MKELIQSKANEEFLRFVFLEGFGYEVKELAEMFQTSPSTIKNIKSDLLEKQKEVVDALPLENAVSTFGFVDRRFNRSDNFLRYFFMNLRESDGVNSQKKFERCYAILEMLQQKEATYSEVETMLYGLDQVNDRKESRPTTYLSWLLEEGIIELKNKNYHLVSLPLKDIEIKVVYRLLAFTLERLSKNPLSYHGEQIFEGLWNYVMMDDKVQCVESPLIAHGSNFLRILDEHKVQLLQQAIREQRYIHHVYFKQPKLRFVNAKKLEKVEQKLFLPVKLVYDHMYGRWYVIGRDNRKNALKETTNFTVKKVDLISHLHLLESQPDTKAWAVYNEKINQKMKNSWLVSQSNALQRVQLKFSIEDPHIEQRLQREKRWGTIEALDDQHVLYTIDVRDDFEMRPWIRSFSHHVQVLQPATLIEDLTKELEARLARYSDV